VEQETADKFHGFQRHHTEPVASLIVFPPEDHLTVFQGHEPLVRDGDAMGIAREVLEDVLGLAQGFLRIDDPCGTPKSPQEALPGLRCRKLLTAAAQRELAPAVDVLQRREEQALEAPAEDLHRQEEVRAAGEPSGPVGCQAPSGEDTVEMRVMVELLAPGMEHRQAADVRPEMLRVPGDILERLRHGPKEEVIEHPRVVEAQGTEDMGQRKDDMDVGNVKHLALPSGEPGRLGGPMALGAVVIATGVIADLFVATLVTLRRVPPKGCSPADGDGPEGAVLFWGQGRTIAREIGGAILLDHISQFEWRAGHKAWSSGNASSGLGVACRACGVTWR
jgi:hypothetical protein